MKRRDFITLLGTSAAAWPLAARAQQAGMPVIAYLSSRSEKSDASMLVAFRRGLSEGGYVEGRNLTIEYRYANGQYDRLPTLATDLIRRQVAVIVHTGAGATPEAAWQLMRVSQIPIVFNIGSDPVRLGLVASMNRPGGTMTGSSSLIGQLTGKTLGLLHELLPNAKTIALLIDPNIGSNFIGDWLTDAREAAVALRLQLIDLHAGTESEIDAAFAMLSQRPPDAVFVASSPFFVASAKQIASLAAHHGVPAIYGRREFAEAGGLISYGFDVADGYRQMGNYAARILKGTKPADLPVFQPTKFELVINLKTAKAIGLEIPAKLLALTDAVVE